MNEFRIQRGLPHLRGSFPQTSTIRGGTRASARMNRGDQFSEWILRSPSLNNKISVTDLGKSVDFVQGQNSLHPVAKFRLKVELLIRWLDFIMK